MDRGPGEIPCESVEGQYIEAGKPTIKETIKDLSNVNKTLVRWRVDNTQIVRRQTSAKFFTYRLCDLLGYLNLYVWRICSYYEFARERKFTRYCINQNPPLNLLLKPRIKSTPLNVIVLFTNSQSAFRFQRDKSYAT